MGEADDKLTAPAPARPACAWADAVAAYLDGELAAGEAFVFEEHLKSCDSCRPALADQRRLMGLITAAVSGPHEAVVLPADFTRVVAARARSDMASVRRPSEKRRAALLALALGLVAFALLGARGWGDVFSPLAAIARAATAAAAMAFHSASEAAAGAVLLLRGLGGYLLRAEPASAAVSLAALACAVLLLLRLITKYHRATRPD